MMAMMGRLQENYRLPMVPVTTATRQKLATIADELSLLAQVPQHPQI
jgi:4-hydroxy-tetrahydrodipicolinate synthase